MLYNLTLDLDRRDLDTAKVDAYMTALDGFHPSLSTGARSATSVTISLPAESLDLAVRTAIPLVEHATGAHVIAVNAMTSDEFDARHGFDPLPELVGPAEIADILGMTRQNVNLMLNAHKFATGQKVGGSWVAARAEVEQLAAKSNRDTPTTAEVPPEAP